MGRVIQMDRGHANVALALWLAVAGACGDGGDADAGPDAMIRADGATGGDGGPLDADLPPTECSDGVDNDGDGLVDWQLDLGCTGPRDGTEGGLNNVLDDGWTVFEAAPDTRIFYVSSSTGDDTWSGLAPEWDGTDGPKATVAAAVALMEDGRPDWLLFRRGDVWVDEPLGNWSISGRSETEPVIIGSYGDSTARPRFEVSETWLVTHGGGGASEQRSHVRILGAHVFMYSKAPDDSRFTGRGGSCVQWLRDGGDVLIEDLRCDYTALSLQSDPTLPFTLRRSVISGNYSLDSHAQSMFTSIDAPFLVEENLLNHGGWNDVVRLALWAPEGDVALWAAISDGRFRITLDGVDYDIDGVDLSAATNMDEVAAALTDAINAAPGAPTVELRHSAAGAFQLRAPSLDSGPGYGVATYGGAAAGTDLGPLFGLSSQGSPESTIFNRNLYLSHGFGNTTVRGNIDANGASGGLQLRMGGTCEDNLFLNDPIAIVFGSNENDGDEYVGGAIRNNVILGARDIDTQPQGTGITIHSYTSTDTGGHSLIRGLEVSGNVLAHQVHGTSNTRALRLGGDGAHDDVSIHDNIVYDWARPWLDPMDQRAYGLGLDCVASSTEIRVFDNLFQQVNGGFVVAASNGGSGVTLSNNTYYSTAPDPPDVWSRGWFQLSGAVSATEWVTATGETGMSMERIDFVDPDRTIETYAASLGFAATYEAFMAEALLQSRLTWRSELTAAAVNAYVRAGFERR